jgi:hypothetical protein
MTVAIQKMTLAEFLAYDDGTDNVYPSFITLRTVKSFAITISVIQKAIANDFTVSFNFQP